MSAVAALPPRPKSPGPTIPVVDPRTGRLTDAWARHMAALDQWLEKLDVALKTDLP